MTPHTPRRPDWVKSGHAGWSARDSMGYAVFQDRLWILGGWLDSWSACPRDVWSSPDGQNWELVRPQAPWVHGDFPLTLVHDHQLWVMGGWYNGRLPDARASNEIWSSPNGADWHQVSTAAWSPRVGAAAVSFAGRMWILGGVQDYYHGGSDDRKNDVWSSSDGRHWELVQEHAPWAPRAFHQAVVFQNHIWLFGGGNYLPEYEAFQDVWRSPDGIHWTRIGTKAPWHPRLWFSALTYRDCLWVMGGWSKEPFRDWNDVWYSHDGLSWHGFETKTIWAGRHAQAGYVFQDALWIAGGLARPLSNEIWTLQLPGNWTGV